MSRRTWCKHYNGTVNEKCKKGIKYADVALDHEPIEINPPGRVSGPMTVKRSLPCIQEYNAGGATCPECVFRTPEEVEAEEKASRKRFMDTMTARATIVEAIGGPWKKGAKGASGSIPCRICGTGSLSYSRAGINGHIHAHCSTPGCVAWME